MKDIGTVTHFLQLEVHTTGKGIFLYQQTYTHYPVDLACLADAKAIATPPELNVTYHHDDNNLISDPALSGTFVESLVYLTMIRPNISQLFVNLCMICAISICPL